MSDTRLYLNKKRKIDTEIKEQKSSFIPFQHDEKKASKTPFNKHADVSRKIIFPMLSLEDNESLIRQVKASINYLVNHSIMLYSH